MKKLCVGAVALLSLMACNSKNELSQKTARELILKQFATLPPKSYVIYMGDQTEVFGPKFDTLVNEGYIKRESSTLGDAGNRLISLTALGKKYLMSPEPGQDATADRVYIAKAKLDRIDTVIFSDKATVATVKYTKVYDSISRFAILLKKNLNEPLSCQQKFELVDGKWIPQGSNRIVTR